MKKPDERAKGIEGEGINPSAPSAGTAGWGSTTDERQTSVGKSTPEASSPDSRGAGDVRFTSYPQNEAAQNPAADARPSHGLQCSEATQRDCLWSVTGHNEEELLGYLRAHAREAHGKNEFTPEELRRARMAVHPRAA